MLGRGKDVRMLKLGYRPWLSFARSGETANGRMRQWRYGAWGLCCPSFLGPLYSWLLRSLFSAPHVGMWRIRRTITTTATAMPMAATLTTAT